MVFGLPFINSLSKICETCGLGKKNHRDPFPTRKSWGVGSPLSWFIEIYVH